MVNQKEMARPTKPKKESFKSWTKTLHF
jgi:hypothetical protein